MTVFKFGDRVAVARSFGVYEAGECGTVVGQIRPYIHVALDNPRPTLFQPRDGKTPPAFFQPDELIKIPR
jgi:hypothetical protein